MTITTTVVYKCGYFIALLCLDIFNVTKLVLILNWYTYNLGLGGIIKTTFIKPYILIRMEVRHDKPHFKTPEQLTNMNDKTRWMITRINIM